VADTVGLRHRDRRDPLGAEAVDDRAVDLELARGLHVDVDVGQGQAALGQEALHQQPVLDRVGVRDAEEMVDEGARTGAPRDDPDAHLPYVVDHLRHREEVGREAVVGDDVQFLVHPLPVGAPGVVAAQHHARRRPGCECVLGGAVPGTHEVRLGEVDGTDAEVVLGVDQALGGGVLGLLQQTVRGVAAVAGGLDDPLGDLEHGLLVLEPGRSGVQLLGGVDGDEAAGGVRDAGDRAEPRVGVPYGVAEHGADALLDGEAEGTGGQAQRAGSGARAAVPYGLQAQGVAVDLPPGREEPGRAVRPPRGEGAAHVGGGTEQNGQTVGVVVGPGQQRGALGRGSPVLTETAPLERGRE
jgi:hypothetical protein